MFRRQRWREGTEYTLAYTHTTLRAQTSRGASNPRRAKTRDRRPTQRELRRSRPTTTVANPPENAATTRGLGDTTLRGKGSEATVYCVRPVTTATSPAVHCERVRKLRGPVHCGSPTSPLLSTLPTDRRATTPDDLHVHCVPVPRARSYVHCELLAPQSDACDSRPDTTALGDREVRYPRRPHAGDRELRSLPPTGEPLDRALRFLWHPDRPPSDRELRSWADTDALPEKRELRTSRWDPGDREVRSRDTDTPSSREVRNWRATQCPISKREVRRQMDST